MFAPARCCPWFAGRLRTQHGPAGLSAGFGKADDAGRTIVIRFGEHSSLRRDLSSGCDTALSLERVGEVTAWRLGMFVLLENTSAECKACWPPGRSCR